MEKDDLLDDCIEYAKSRETISCAMLQSKFRLGYNRGGRIMDELENMGIVAPFEGSKERRVLIRKENISAINFKGQGSLSNDDIYKIAVDFVKNNMKAPKDRILFFEYGMREFRDKYFEPLMHQRDMFNKNVCNNISNSKDEIVIKCNNDYYAWKKTEEGLRAEIKKLKEQLVATPKMK